MNRRARSSGKIVSSAPPQGLGLGLQLGAAPVAQNKRGRRLLRQATLAKYCPAALPMFDVSVAVLQSLDDMRSAVGEDMVLASTLHVPAHHVLACQAEAYGTPFQAPALQTLHGASSLSEDDKQFAACLAAPPDMEESGALGSFTVQHRLIRMASLARAQQQPTPQQEARSAASAGGAEGRFHLLDRSDSMRRRAPPVRTRSVAEDDGDGGEALAGATSDATQRLAQRDEREQQAAAAATAAAAAARQQQLQQQRAEAAGLQVQVSVRPSAAGAPLGPVAEVGGPAAPLFENCRDAVGALVGLGALLLRGFSARAAPAEGLVERRVRALMGVRELVARSPEGDSALRRQSAVFFRAGAEALPRSRSCIT